MLTKTKNIVKIFKIENFEKNKKKKKEEEEMVWRYADR